MKDKSKDDDNDGIGGGGNMESDISQSDTPEKEIKCSTTDPDSGWFHKGEHKEVFAYAIEAACDKNGWILGYTIHPGNEHDSMTFPALFEKLSGLFKLDKLILDAGYKTPAIAKLLLDANLTPVFPYKGQAGKKGFMKKNQYVYDEYHDCYICPGNQILTYCTTNREGYREYKSNGNICANCPRLSECTKSKNHEKVIMQHVWNDYMEICEDIRYTTGMKELYNKRKETIENNKNIEDYDTGRTL